MPDATNLQTTFLGGEIAPSFQGRADHPKYREGMSLCYNALPVETGAWTRRPGTRMAALTRGGAFARIMDFDFSQNAPYTAEFTDSHLRFFSTYSLVHTYDEEVVQAISTGNPAVVTVNGNTVYANGDSVEFTLTNAALEPDQGSLLEDRQFVIGSVSGATFELFDPVTGVGIDGSTLNFTTGTPCIVQRVLDLPTPYAAQMLQNIRGVQALNGTVNTLVLLHNQVTPQALVSTDPPNPVFTLSPAVFQDGPYLDPPAQGTTITPSGVGPGTVNLVASAPTFAVTDVGRHIRLLSQPANWSSATAYTTGELVTYQDAYYVALQNSTGAIPGTDAVNWGVATNANAWVWAVITGFTDNEHVAADFKTTPALPGVLVNTNAIPDTNYRLGLFSDSSSYPACGTYHEGRLWLSGAIGNRIDGSVSNDIFNFSPTAVDGTVADNNAIDYTFNAQDINSIFWMTPQQTGIICGTQAGEWLIQASTAGDVLTPTSIQAKRVTKYGGANVEPVNAPFATLFVERNNRKMLEYLADVFTGKYSAINVSLTGSHLLASGVDEVRYQKELAPVAWARMDDGSFAGMTYRRESPMLSEQPAFAGWHSHALGTGRTVVSISVGPNVTGDLDTLSMVTYDITDQLYRVELLTDIFPDNGTNQDAWFVDGGTTPAGSILTPTELTLYGLHNFEGKTVSAYIAGIDAGDFTVTNGQIAIALPAGFNNSGLLTEAAIAAASDLTNESPSAMSATFDNSAAPSGIQSIQSYIGPTTPVTGVDTGNMLVDARNSRVFEFSAGNGSTNGIRVFDMISGLQTNQATHDQIFGAGSPLDIIGPYCLGFDGNIYTVNGTSNSTRWLVIDPNLLRIVGGAGANSASFDFGANSIPYPANLAPARVGGKSFVVGPSLSNVTKSINVVETTNGSVQNAGSDYQMTENTGFSCPTVDGMGVVYTMGQGADLGFYRTTISESASRFNLGNFPNPITSNYFSNPGITHVRLGTVTPADVDPTWSSFASVSGPCYDQSDGNLIFLAFTNDSVTNRNYVIKINSDTCAVVWTVPIASIPASGGVNVPNSTIHDGLFGLLSVTGGSGLVYYINTIAGTATSAGISGFGNIGSSIWDSNTNSIFANGSFANTGGSPTLLNSTPANFSNQWFRFSENPWKQFYIVPAAVGTTFTSRGQLLRPLAPQETGARNGPALGKTRRNHRFAALLLNTAGVYFGTTFDKLHKALFKSPGGKTTYADNQLFSEVWTDPLEDNNSYDGQLCWQVTRPYPVNVLAVQAFVETQDR